MNTKQGQSKIKFILIKIDFIYYQINNNFQRSTNLSVINIEFMSERLVLTK